ncbi:5147_t:CDS:1, partial [Cetraspora pellucida]
NMEEFLLKASFDSDSSQESKVGIATEHDEKVFMFDWQLLRKACELTESDEETNELTKSDNEFSESDNMVEEFKKPVFWKPNPNTNHFCIVVDYNKNQQMIQRCNTLGNHRVYELSGT